MSQKRAPGRDGRAPSPRESRRRLAPRRRGRALPWPGGRDCALSAMSLKSCTYTPPDFPAPPDGRRRWLRCRPAASVANVPRTMAPLSQPTTPGRTQRTVIVTGNRVRSHPKGLCAGDDASQANESAVKKTDNRAAGRVGTRVTGWRGQRNRARVRIHLFNDPLFCFVVVTIQYLDGFSIFLKHKEAALFSPPAPGSPLPTILKSAQSLNNAEPCVQALFFVGMVRHLRNLARATEPHLEHYPTKLNHLTGMILRCLFMKYPG